MRYYGNMSELFFVLSLSINISAVGIEFRSGKLMLFYSKDQTYEYFKVLTSDLIKV